MRKNEKENEILNGKEENEKSTAPCYLRVGVSCSFTRPADRAVAKARRLVALAKRKEKDGTGYLWQQKELTSLHGEIAPSLYLPDLLLLISGADDGDDEDLHARGWSRDVQRRSDIRFCDWNYSRVDVALD